MKLALLLLLLGPGTYNQVSVQGTYQKRPPHRLVALSNMCRNNDSTCTPTTYTAKIVGVGYKPNTDQIDSFVLQLKNRRKEIGIDPDIYNHMTNADRGSIQSLISKGNQVRVLVYACGSGDVETVYSIQLWNSN
jgi:tetrahydromethanopterin S-methyltransferase subunit F